MYTCILTSLVFSNFIYGKNIFGTDGRSELKLENTIQFALARLNIGCTAVMVGLSLIHI